MTDTAIFRSLRRARLCTLLCAALVLGAGAVAAQPAPRNAPGELRPIWRNQPVIGIWLSGGQGLEKVPAYLDHTDFPYARRPYPEEVPFADRLTVVRLLGGWIPSDLGKGETRGYDAIAEADLVTRRHGGPSLRTTPLIDLGPLDCDDAAGRCTGDLHWTVPEGQALQITSEGAVLVCADSPGRQAVGDFRIGTERVFDVFLGKDCPMNGTQESGQQPVGSMTVDPSELVYHFELMKARLDPYIAAGYTDLTLVLDNFPWDLPYAPVTGTIGQTAPPASVAEWAAFVDRMTGALIAYYGRPVVERFRFRLGTEQQSKDRFSGTPEQYLALYEATVETIRGHLPDAVIGPFNQAGTSADPEGLTYAYLYRALPDPGYIGYVAHSLYYVPRVRQGTVANTHISQRLPALRRLWAGLPIPRGVPVEFQEFGVLRNVQDVPTPEPGARGAAMHVADVFDLLGAGVGGLWHWTAFERLIVAREGVETRILLGRGWLYLVLERFLGGTVYDVSPLAGAEDAPMVGAHYIDMDEAGGGADALVVSAFNLDPARDSPDPRKVTVTVPKELMPDPGAARIDQVALNQGNAVYDLIRADLAAEGLLAARFADLPGAPTGFLKEMTGPEGQAFVARNWDRYRAGIEDTLMRQPAAPAIAEETESYRITLDLPAPGVLVLLLAPGG